MRQLIKYFLSIGFLVSGFQTAWAFSLLGPVGNGGDAYQITEIGYNPLPNGNAPPFFIDGNAIGPKNLNEGYRHNTPVMYYTFDPSFEWFGSNGEFAVQQAFDLLNGAFNGQTNTPVFLYAVNNGTLSDTNGGLPITLNTTNGLDSYLTDLSGLPFNSEGENYQAFALGLLDLKSVTLSALLEQLGLADAVRYTWALRDREHSGIPPCPAAMLYTVIERNFDVLPSDLQNIQYSSFVNGEMFTYFIFENCDAPPPFAPPAADALEIPVDPLNNNPPVASGLGEGFFGTGFFYTGLTRDDVGGLRWLYSTNNYDTPSAGYRESPAAGSTSFNFGSPQLLFTSNYNALVSAAMTNSPAALQALFPGLIVGANPFTYFSNVVSPNVVAYFTNYIGSPAGTPATLVTVTTLVTNIVQFYQNSFGNVVTNPFHPVYSNTTFAIQTITVGPQVGSPAGSPFVTNVTYQPFQSNVVSGDYFIISNGACPPNIIQTVQVNVNTVTNLIAGTTNANGQSFTENLISYFTNYVFAIQPCTLATNGPSDYQGIGRIQFIRVLDGNYDYQSGLFLTPITNEYDMVMVTNGQYVTQHFQRVVTAPDFLFGAADQAQGPAADPIVNVITRTIPNFNQANIQRGLAGPGTIDPGAFIAFDKVGPIFENTGPAFLTGPVNAAGFFFQWASFDGTTNAPVLYPNGASLVNLANAAVVHISPAPPVLPPGTNGVPYNLPLTVTSGGTPPYVWSLAPNSAGLPPGLTLSSGGVISGIPTQSRTFDGINVQVTDSSTPSRTVQFIYSQTIN